MKLVSVILLFTCFVEFFDYSTGNASPNCTEDTDCTGEESAYCINNSCYPKVNYGSYCDYPRQCYRPNQNCFNNTCECTSGKKWGITGCVSNPVLWSAGEISGLSIGLLSLVIVLIAVIEITRRRQKRTRNYAVIE